MAGTDTAQSAVSGEAHAQSHVGVCPGRRVNVLGQSLGELYRIQTFLEGFTPPLAAERATIPGTSQIFACRSSGLQPYGENGWGVSAVGVEPF